MTIAENIARIRANMAAAAREAGRDPKEILLVGASLQIHIVTGKISQRITILVER